MYTRVVYRICKAATVCTRERSMEFLGDPSLCYPCVPPPDNSTSVQVAYFLGSFTDCVVLIALLRFIYTLSLRHLTQTVGLALSIGVNLLLKEIIAQPRPPAACLDGFGMPSGDAQQIVVATLLILSSESRHRDWKAVVTVFLIIVEAWSRVALGVHTVGQVVVGVAVGFLWGAAWIALTRYTFANLRGVHID